MTVISLKKSVGQKGRCGVGGEIVHENGGKKRTDIESASPVVCSTQGTFASHMEMDVEGCSSV